MALNPGEIGRTGATPDRERLASRPGAGLTRVRSIDQRFLKNTKKLYSRSDDE